MMQYGSVIKIGYILFALWDPKQSRIAGGGGDDRRVGVRVRAQCTQGWSSPIPVNPSNVSLSSRHSDTELHTAALASLLCKLSNDTTATAVRVYLYIMESCVPWHCVTATVWVCDCVCLVWPSNPICMVRLPEEETCPGGIKLSQRPKSVLSNVRVGIGRNTTHTRARVPSSSQQAYNAHTLMTLTITYKVGPRSKSSHV